MNDEKPSERDRRLAAAIKLAAPEARQVPDFDAVFGEAEQQRRRSAVRTFSTATAACVAALAALAWVILPSEVAPPPDFIEISGLLETTSWTAPSDVLLPEHEFDIFTEIPTLMESTDSVEGALL